MTAKLEARIEAKADSILRETKTYIATIPEKMGSQVRCLSRENRGQNERIEGRGFGSKSRRNGSPCVALGRS
jgi:hypothetical protein